MGSGFAPRHTAARRSDRLHERGVTAAHQNENRLAPVSQHRPRTNFILLHETAVPDHVGGEYGGKTTLRALFDHTLKQLSDK